MLVEEGFQRLMLQYDRVFTGASSSSFEPGPDSIEAQFARSPSPFTLADVFGRLSWQSSRRPAVSGAARARSSRLTPSASRCDGVAPLLLD
jgi:hypothetical protein